MRSVVDPGIRNLISKYVVALRLLPENVAVNKPPAFAALGTKDTPVALGAFAAVRIVATSPAGKLGQGLGPGPEYEIHWLLSIMLRAPLVADWSIMSNPIGP